MELAYSISGGYLTSPMPVRTMTLPRSDRVKPTRPTFGPSVEGDHSHADDTDALAGLAHVFVKLDKSAGWMVKAVGGTSAQRGCLKRTILVEEL